MAPVLSLFSDESIGAVAQMGERMTGSHEVRVLGNIKPLFTRAHPPAPPGAPLAAPVLRSQRRPLDGGGWGWVTGSRRGWGLTRGHQAVSMTCCPATHQQS